MNTKQVSAFLLGIAANNNRPWFRQHRAEYDTARADFERDIASAIAHLARFDASIAHANARDAIYRFYRDVRFTPDKSPYDRHFGALIGAHGKQAMHGGYYIHFEPGRSMLSCGCYWLPTNVLTACRNEIMAHTDEWLAAVENDDFVRLFGRVGEHEWDEPGSNGFGLARLKTCPKGFPKDYEHIEYLRMKDYCCWHAVPDDFFEGDWFADACDILRPAKPMMDFINNVVDDYE